MVNIQMLNIEDVVNYVEENIGTFHQKRISSLDKLQLSIILKRKNPYLFKAKYILTAEKIIRGFVDARRRYFWRLVRRIGNIH